MSEAVSALSGAEYKGYVAVRDAGLCGMVSLRGDLSASKVKAAVKKATGTVIPGPRKIALTGDTGIAWMSPDELLLLCPHDRAAGLAADLSVSLKSVHHLVADVSDARAVIDLEGAAVREVLAKLTPADTANLPQGEVRRSKLAQVAAAFWMTGDTSARVVCFRSVADYAFGVLKVSATPGSEVG